jgi:ATP-dependent exoDNAse (exonuclease V) alpha subunit
VRSTRERNQRGGLLDRTLVYTALTRANDSVVFIGTRTTLRGESNVLRPPLNAA